MRKILLVIIAAVIAIAVFMNVNWHGLDFSLSIPLFSGTSVHDETDSEEDDKLWIDTIMCAGGHTFGYGGDVSMCGDWYFDTIPVGDDRMLSCDSVGPSTLRLNLVTRQLIVDLVSPDAADKIKDFLNPVDGFKRFQREYEVCLDSIEDEEYGTMKCMGHVSIVADYADSGNENADKINRFICDLTDVPKNGSVNIPALSAFYAGYNPTKYYRTVYTGVADDMSDLSDFIANRTFKNWRRGDDLSFLGSMESALEVRASIITSGFVTFSMYEYERAGIGHGMYTETFHTFDLESGKGLSNDDIFKPRTLDKVTSQLFDVIAKDAHYAAWNEGVESGADVRTRIEHWQSPSPILEGTEWEGLDNGLEFELPEGALTDSGVVFSFQPYEIDCWAAGAFHFIVPYKKLMPYLTTKAKGLISE